MRDVVKATMMCLCKTTRPRMPHVRCTTDTAFLCSHDSGMTVTVQSCVNRHESQMGHIHCTSEGYTRVLFITPLTSLILCTDEDVEVTLVRIPPQKWGITMTTSSSNRQNIFIKSDPPEGSAAHSRIDAVHQGMQLISVNGEPAVSKSQLAPHFMVIRLIV